MNWIKWFFTGLPLEVQGKKIHDKILRMHREASDFKHYGVDRAGYPYYLIIGETKLKCLAAYERGLAEDERILKQDSRHSEIGFEIIVDTFNKTALRFINSKYRYSQNFRWLWNNMKKG